MKSYLRHERYLVVQRAINFMSSDQGQNKRITIGFPSNLVDVLNYNTTFRVEKRSAEWSEFVIIPDEESQDAKFKSNKLSTIVLSKEVSKNIPFNIPGSIGLDIDMQKPHSNGILVTELRNNEKARLSMTRKKDYIEATKGGK